MSSFQELSNRQISAYARLAGLCEQKYNLPDAATALKRLIVDRRYEVVPLTFLEQPFRRFAVEEEGHAQLPCLPTSCWQLMAEFKR